jgi:CubicO group peptidase (beta-lactamase class C family)
LGWVGNYGKMNLEKNMPVADDTLFYIASVTKTVTKNH